MTLQLLELARKVQAQVCLLEDEIKKVDRERDMGTMMRTAVEVVCNIDF